MAYPTDIDFATPSTRKDKFDLITDESIAVPSSPYKAAPAFRILRTDPNTVEIWRSAGKTGGQLTETFSLPVGVDEFFVDYQDVTTPITFNAADTGVTLFLHYKAFGSALSKTHINAIESAINAIETKLGLADGSIIGSLYKALLDVPLANSFNVRKLNGAELSIDPFAINDTTVWPSSVISSYGSGFKNCVSIGQQAGIVPTSFEYYFGTRYGSDGGSGWMKGISYLEGTDFPDGDSIPITAPNTSTVSGTLPAKTSTGNAILVFGGNSIGAGSHEWNLGNVAGSISGKATTVDGVFGEGLSIVPSSGVWDGFAAIADGLKTLSFSSGGSVNYYFLSAAFSQAFNGTSHAIRISEEGDVYVNTISAMNLVVDRTGLVGSAGVYAAFVGAYVEIPAGTTVTIMPISPDDAEASADTYNGYYGYTLKNKVKLNSKVTLKGFNESTTIIRRDSLDCYFYTEAVATDSTVSVSSNTFTGVSLTGAKIGDNLHWFNGSSTNEFFKIIDIATSTFTVDRAPASESGTGVMTLLNSNISIDGFSFDGRGGVHGLGGTNYTDSTDPKAPFILAYCADSKIDCLIINHHLVGSVGANNVLDTSGTSVRGLAIKGTNSTRISALHISNCKAVGGAGGHSDGSGGTGTQIGGVGGNVCTVYGITFFNGRIEECELISGAGGVADFSIPNSGYATCGIDNCPNSTVEIVRSIATGASITAGAPTVREGGTVVLGAISSPDSIVKVSNSTGTGGNGNLSNDHYSVGGRAIGGVWLSDRSIVEVISCTLIAGNGGDNSIPFDASRGGNAVGGSYSSHYTKNNVVGCFLYGGNSGASSSANGIAGGYAVGGSESSNYSLNNISQSTLVGGVGGSGSVTTAGIGGSAIGGVLSSSCSQANILNCTITGGIGGAAAGTWSGTGGYAVGGSESSTYTTSTIRKSTLTGGHGGTGGGTGGIGGSAVGGEYSSVNSVTTVAECAVIAGTAGNSGGGVPWIDGSTYLLGLLCNYLLVTGNNSYTGTTPTKTVSGADASHVYGGNFSYNNLLVVFTAWQTVDLA